MIEIRDTVRGIEGVEGKGYGVSPPQPTKGSGSIVSSPTTAWDSAPAKSIFGAF